MPARPRGYGRNRRTGGFRSRRRRSAPVREASPFIAPPRGRNVMPSGMSIDERPRTINYDFHSRRNRFRDVDWLQERVDQYNRALRSGQDITQRQRDYYLLIAQELQQRQDALHSERLHRWADDQEVLNYDARERRADARLDVEERNEDADRDALIMVEAARRLDSVATRPRRSRVARRNYDAPLVVPEINVNPQANQWFEGVMPLDDIPYAQVDHFRLHNRLLRDDPQYVQQYNEMMGNLQHAFDTYWDQPVQGELLPYQEEEFVPIPLQDPVAPAPLMLEWDIDEIPEDPNDFVQQEDDDRWDRYDTW